MDMLFILHLGGTLMMTGLIWLIQVVHYPLFAEVGANQFARYEMLHGKRITVVVLPLMMAELLTGVVLLLHPVACYPKAWSWTGAGLIVLIWLSTAFLQVPQHTVLRSGFDEQAYRRLVRTNWIRTLAWSARSILLLAALAQRTI